MTKKIDRFRIIETLAESGAAIIYQAEELLPGSVKRLVTLKVFPPSSRDATHRPEDDLQAYHDEIRILALLDNHPHIAALHAAGVTDDVHWLALEYLPTTLAAAIGNDPADSAAVTRLIEQIAQALAAMHALEPPVLHNDLRPANVLIDALGNHKLTDFGVAALPADQKTLQASAVRYAAPELISRELGAVRPASDLYALGHMAFELALGSRLHRQQFAAVYGDERNPSKEAPPARWMAWHCSPGTRIAPVHEFRKDFPRALSEIIAKLMHKSPADRYASASEVLADLKQATPTPAPAAPDSPPDAPQRPLTPVPAGPDPTTPPIPPAANLRYYVRLRGRVTGPFDLATLQRQARQGLLSRLHQVSVDQVTWKSAGQAEGLFGNPASS